MASAFRPQLVLAAALAFLAYPTPVLSAAQFQQFFPGWASLIQGILRDNCTEPLADASANPESPAKWVLIDCILDVFSESRKAEVAAAALTLGLAPTILQTISASTADTSLLFLRRPVLAFLLAAASPSPSNPSSSRYEDPLVAIRHPADLDALPAVVARPTLLAKVLVSFVEYVLAGFAAANVAVLAYQLGTWSFFASANNPWDPALWIYTTILIHMCGIIGLCLRIKVLRTAKRPPEGYKSRNQAWLARGLIYEMTPAAYGTPLILVPRNPRPSLLAELGSWVLSIAPTLQLLYGTIILSGQLLMDHGDAKDCLFRFLFSAVVARGVLAFELHGMRCSSWASYGMETQDVHRLVEMRKDASEETPFQRPHASP